MPSISPTVSSDPSSNPESSPVILSYPSSRQPTPLFARQPAAATSQALDSSSLRQIQSNESDTGAWHNDWDEEDDTRKHASMSLDLPSPSARPSPGMSRQPLLGAEGAKEQPYGESPAAPTSRFHERDPELAAKQSTRRRYIYAAGFLLLSLISFVVQTETAVYIQTELGWNKAYSMLYLTHGSWSVLWVVQLLILRLQKHNMPWSTFWRRHVQNLRQTALMIQYQDVTAPQKYPDRSPLPYMLRTIVFITTSLTVAGGSWYVAVDLTTADDLTAIYNCSAFFAYVFSIFLLKEKVRTSKVISVLIALVGVFIVAYGGAADSADRKVSSTRALGNIVISVGSVLYGFYEVLYKWLACPPDGTSPGRSMIFANMVGSCMGVFTLTVLWVPIPVLHYLGWEIFELPRGDAAWMLLISTFSNAVFSGSFLVLISLTSPVLSSVAALITIFLVGLVSELLPPPLYTPLSSATIYGGCLIIGAFCVLSYATYKEMDEERKQKPAEEIAESDSEGDASLA